MLLDHTRNSPPICIQLTIIYFRILATTAPIQTTTAATTTRSTTELPPNVDMTELIITVQIGRTVFDIERGNKYSWNTKQLGKELYCVKHERK